MVSYTCPPPPQADMAGGPVCRISPEKVGLTHKNQKIHRNENN